MINHTDEGMRAMRDLDQSDVDRDAEEMKEQAISDLVGDLDPADLYGVCAMICDEFFSGDVEEFIKSHIAANLTQSTQSNPNGVLDRIAEALRMDFA